MSRSWEKVLRLLPYLRRYWVGELFVFILMLIGTLLSQIPPFLMKALIDDALLQKDVHLLFLIVITMFAMNVAGSGLSLWQTYIYSRVSERILFDIQLDLFQHIQRLPLSFFQRMKVGDVMSRVGGDVNQIQGVLSGAVLNFVSSIDESHTIGAFRASCKAFAFYCAKDPTLITNSTDSNFLAYRGA